MIHDWIEAEGKDVVKKLIEKIKRGEDSVKAFLELGGNKIVKKYNGTIVHRSKCLKYLKNVCYYAYLFF